MKSSNKKELIWFRKLVEEFSTLTGYEGYEIAEVELNKTKLDDYTAYETKKKERFAIINVVKNGKKIAIKLICPVEISRDFFEQPIDFEGKWSWNIDEIERFTDAVGDTNSIHHGEQAIVPGLLMLETMLINLQEEETVWEKIKMRFYQPVFASQIVRIVEDKTMYIATTKEENICWRMWLS